MSIKEKSNSAQVNALKKMREEYAAISTPESSEDGSNLNKILAKTKRKKHESSTETNGNSTITPDITTPISVSSSHTPIHSSSQGMLVRLPVSKFKPWKFANRSELEMGDIDELARSIKEDGQTVPVLARPCKPENDDVQYEVIYGHRRWRACKLCNIDLYAIILDLDDQAAAKEQKKENERRKDLSEFSESFSYKQMLDEGMFDSQVQLAAYLGMKQQTLSNILSYTNIPSQVLDAMQKPHLLPQRTAIKLANICKNISETEINTLCEIAPLIISKKIPYNDLNIDFIRNYYNKDKIEDERNTYRRQVIVNKNNVKLCTAGLNQNKVPSITFSKYVVDNNLYEEVLDLVSTFLKKKSES
jgi:ParB/RepB/Spo0J family partition protein